MRTWKQNVLLNLAAVIGIAISLFVVPGNTPLWVWLTIAAVFLAVFNILLFSQRGRIRGGSAASTRTIIIALGFALLVVDLILSRYFR